MTKFRQSPSSLNDLHFDFAIIQAVICQIFQNAPKWKIQYNLNGKATKNFKIFWTNYKIFVHSANYISATWAVKLIHFMPRSGSTHSTTRAFAAPFLTYDEISTVFPPVWMIYTLILQSFTLSFVNFLSKILFFLQSSWTARKWSQFLSTSHTAVQTSQFLSDAEGI